MVEHEDVDLEGHHEEQALFAWTWRRGSQKGPLLWRRRPAATGIASTIAEEQRYIVFVWRILATGPVPEKSHSAGAVI